MAGECPISISGLFGLPDPTIEFFDFEELFLFDLLLYASFIF